jgi:hypothetical protein
MKEFYLNSGQTVKLKVCQVPKYLARILKSAFLLVTVIPKMVGGGQEEPREERCGDVAIGKNEYYLP